MLNQITLIGRVVDKPVVEENENGRKVSVITLAVPRCFKNSEGVYDTDFIEITLWENLALNAVTYVEKGDTVGVRGRIQSHEDKSISLVAEKVTFLSSGKSEE